MKWVLRSAMQTGQRRPDWRRRQAVATATACCRRRAICAVHALTHFQTNRSVPIIH